MMSTFTRTVIYRSTEQFLVKGFGRIFVKSEPDKQRALEILRAMNPAHFDQHFQEELVTLFNHHGYNLLERNHAFELDVPTFLALCARRDVQVLVYSCDSRRETTLEEQVPYTQYGEKTKELTWVS